MLMLLFHVGDQIFAIDCRNILEIVPLINLNTVAFKGEYVAGAAIFTGQPVTVFDFSQLVEHRDSTHCLTTRIVFLTQNIESQNGSSFGLIVEKAIEIVNIAPAAFVEAGVKGSAFSFFTGLTNLNGRAVQQVDVERLFMFLQEPSHKKQTGNTGSK